MSESPFKERYTYDVPSGPHVDLWPLISTAFPENVRFVSELNKLEEDLRRRFFLAYRNLFHRKKAGSNVRQRSLVTLKLAVEDLSKAIEEYVEIGLDVKLAKSYFKELPMELGAARRPLLEIAKSMVDAPFVRYAFPSLIKESFYRQTAELVDRAEMRLKPEIPDWVFASSSVLERLKNELFVWHKTVRLCIATVVISSIPYREIWGALPPDPENYRWRKAFKDGVHGDAGYYLSEKVATMAEKLLQSPTFVQVKGSVNAYERIAGYVTFSQTQMMQFPVEKKLHGTYKGARNWIDGCKLNKCTVGDLGVTYPWTFHPINGLLFGSDPKPDPFPDHMYARLAAEDRAVKVSRYWNFARGELIRAKVITRPSDFQFVITAGTLRHGGTHPPHLTHRDGSMFDMDLTDLPVMASPFSTDEEPRFSTKRRVPMEVPEYESDDSVLVGSPMAEELLEFAPIEEQIRYIRVARKFTQCIYLTFPGSVIYGARSILEKARDELIARVRKLMDSTVDENRLKKLDDVQKMLLNKELVLRPIIKADHRDHWHVNYNPHLLGDEVGDNGVTIKSIKTEQAESIKTVIKALEKDNLWQEILKE